MLLHRACAPFIATGCGLLALAAGPAWSSCSGLSVIPTADVVGAGRYALELQAGGLLPARQADVYVLNTEFGFGDRFEAGVDFDLSAHADPRVFFNAKYVLAAAGASCALAVGVNDIAEAGKPAPYLVGTADLQAARLHLGALRQEGYSRWFAGADRALTERVTFAADYTSGREQYASVGLEYRMGERASVFAALLFPNGGGDTEFSLHLCFTGSYRHSE
jgi:hypothetical protein